MSLVGEVNPFGRKCRKSRPMRNEFESAAIWHGPCLPSTPEVNVGVVGPGVRETLQGFEGGKVAEHDIFMDKLITEDHVYNGRGRG